MRKFDRQNKTERTNRERRRRFNFLSADVKHHQMYVGWIHKRTDVALKNTKALYKMCNKVDFIESEQQSCIQ